MLNSTVFTAIGVERGDAFFLEKEDKKLLVDGGNSYTRFPRRFVKATGRKHVNVIVCTHGDSDHARGILGFLRKKELSADEVWLPASWMDRLEDLTQKPKEFLMELLTDIEKVRDEHIKDLSRLGDEYATGKSEKEDLVMEVKAEDLMESIEEALYVSVPFVYATETSNMRLKLIIEAVSASRLLRQIFLAACLSGCLIRWFNYIGNNNQINASGGIQDLLVPTNAVEVARIRRPKRSALKYISLTMSNRQSLVFISPRNELNSGVLFTADSDLSFAQTIPWHDRMIITSPHHGSESNKYAYQRFSKEAGSEEDVVWVRSDGRFARRPGKSYLGVSGRKYCTCCRGCRFPKQNVKMMFSKVNFAWQPKTTRPCRCV